MKIKALLNSLIISFFSLPAFATNQSLNLPHIYESDDSNRKASHPLHFPVNDESKKNSSILLTKDQDKNKTETETETKIETDNSFFLSVEMEVGMFSMEEDVLASENPNAKFISSPDEEKEIEKIKKLKTADKKKVKGEAETMDLLSSLPSYKDLTPLSLRKSQPIPIDRPRKNTEDKIYTP